MDSKKPIVTLNDADPLATDDEIVKGLNHLSTRTNPSQEFVEQLDHQLRVRHEQIHPQPLHAKRSLVRLVAGLAAAALVVLLIVPAARSWAQDGLESLFRRSNSDTLVQKVNTVGGDQDIKIIHRQPFDSLDAAEAALGFDIKSPAEIPNGYVLIELNESSGGSMHYFERPGRALMIFQIPIDQIPSEAAGAFEAIGHSAEIVTVTVNGVSAEYVEGTWISRSSPDEIDDENEFTWNPDVSARDLRWIEDNILYVIRSYGGSPESPGYIGMEDMIALAESLE